MLNFNEERLLYKYIITSISDVDKISKIGKDVILCPVFFGYKDNYFTVTNDYD